MSKCIICGKEVIGGTNVVNLKNNKYSAHLDCFAEVIPNATGMNASKEDKLKRRQEIEKKVNELIKDYEKNN